MESIKTFINQHKWLSTIFSIVFIGLPQYIDSLWSLVEKILGRSITVHNITWVYWITVPIAMVMFGIAIWAIRSSKKPFEVKTEILNLTDTLTAMHRRLVELQKQKAKDTKIGFRELDKVLPMLADRMGTIKLKDWPKFKEMVKRRLQQAMPKRNYLHPLSFVQLRERRGIAALSVASQIRKKLFQSKEWTLEDAKEISEWLDRYHWGVKEYRDNNIKWDTLSKSISPYFTDTKLSELIQKHIDFSYFYNNVCLLICYSERFPKTSFTSMLHAELVGSPISPEEVERALGEILKEIQLYVDSLPLISPKQMENNSS